MSLYALVVKQPADYKGDDVYFIEHLKGMKICTRVGPQKFKLNHSDSIEDY